MLTLINLASARDRRERMAEQLAQAGLDYDRVGIDFRDSDPAAIRRWIDAHFAGLSFDQDALSGAEIGCWASHLTAWRRLLDSNARAATVLEDDVVLAPGFAEATARLAAVPGFDVVYLGTSSRNISSRRAARIGPLRVHAPVGVIFNTWGYVIARRWVEWFLSQNGIEIDLPIDHVLGGRVRAVRPFAGVLQPPVVREDPALGADSQIEPYSFRLDRHRLVAGARRRLLGSRLTDLYYQLYRWL
jgi:glycosyl transferase family 25